MFSAFMEAVLCVAPRVIFTDADPAVIAAVLSVFGEDTLHYWCIWHIYQNLDKKFKASMPDYNGDMNNYAGSNVVSINARLADTLDSEKTQEKTH